MATTSDLTKRKRMSIDERRAELISAALKLMKRDGIAAATTRAICAEADMPQGAFHYCFHSKNEFWTALLRDESLRVDPNTYWPKLSPQRSAEENLRDLLLALWAQLETETETHQLLFEFASLLRHPELADLPRLIHEISVEDAIDYIERLRNETQLRFIHDDRTIAEMVMAVFSGLTWAWLYDRDSERARVTLSRFASLISTLARDVRPGTSRPAQGGK